MAFKNRLLEPRIKDDINAISLCRICLQDGASYPIFEKSVNEDNLYNKLLLCLQCKKIEDIEGYPRHICSLCNNTLTTICDFINKFKESSKILENGLKVKKEVNDNNGKSDIEAALKEIKVESDDNFDDIFNDLDDEKPLKVLKKIKKESIRKVVKSRKNSSQRGFRTNKIASSILEGNFLWTGEKWCTKIGQTTIKKLPSKPRPQTKIVVPNQNKQNKQEKKLCDLCGDIFNNQEKLSVHKRKVHFRNPVKCPKCPRICVSEYSLKSHVKRKHEGSKDFICSTCGQGFAFKGELSTHFKNVHNKHLKPKKSYTCKFCQKSYKCPKSVTVHERSVHTGQRPAECTVCGSCFYHEDYLREHMRLHTGETPFKCPICGRGYAQRGNMKSHLRIHKISELDAITKSKMRPNYLKLLKV